jgi:hypothetical protein
MARRRRRNLWLVAALVLFGATAWLLLRDEQKPDSKRPQVEIPHNLRPAERVRMEQRRTLPAPVVMPKQTAQPTARPRPRDPVLAALATGHNKVAVVIEANAIRYSPIGQLLIDCLSNLPGGNPLEQAKTELGIDPLQDLDRVAVTDHGLVLSGNFKNAQFQDFIEKNRAGLQVDTQSYGDNGTVYTVTPPPLEDGGSSDARAMSFASWNNQLLFLGQNPGDAQQAIDRVEGRQDAQPALSEEQTYGEVYGTLSPDALADMLPPDQQELKDQILQGAKNVELHVDATNDVGVSLAVKGSDGTTEDLGRTIAGGLAALRLKAKAEGDDEASELLDYARVDPNGKNFAVDMALPMAWFEKQLAWCRDPKARAEHFHLDAGTDSPL